MECAEVSRQPKNQSIEYKWKTVALGVSGWMLICSGVFVELMVTWYAVLVVNQYSIVTNLFNSAEAMTGVHSGYFN